jgi:hypothetical protein
VCISKGGYLISWKVFCTHNKESLPLINMGTLSRSNCEHLFEKHIERGVGKSEVIRDNNSFLSYCD